MKEFWTSRWTVHRGPGCGEAGHDDRIGAEELSHSELPSRPSRADDKTLSPMSHLSIRYPKTVPSSGRSGAGAGLVTWAGLVVVLAAAAVLSFAALRELAVAVRIPELLAPLLPIAVDAGAAVSCATWLSRRVDRDTTRFACGMTWALLT